MFLIFVLLILKMGALAEFTFLNDTIVGVSLQTQTFMRTPFFVTIVAFLGFVSDAASSVAADIRKLLTLQKMVGLVIRSCTKKQA